MSIRFFFLLIQLLAIVSICFGEVFHGSIKSYSDEKTSGFITPDAGGEDVRFSIFDSPGHYPFKAGDKVQYHLEDSSQGTKAVYVIRT